MDDRRRDSNDVLLHNSLEDLFNRFYQSVYKAAFFIAGDRGLAEDAAQDTFVKAYHKLDQLRDQNKAEAWLTRIAINSARDLLRRRKRVVVPLEQDLPDNDDPSSPERALMAAEERKTVLAVLQELPGEYQDVVYLKYYREFTTKQISVFLEIPEGTVKTRLRKARSIIASRLEITESARISGQGG